VGTVRESSFVLKSATAWNAIAALILFLVVHFALLVGVTTPEKLYFDEVHYVPAARQMLEPVTPPGAQPDASAAGKAVDRAVDPDRRR
jgi:hypothetical protein